LADFGQRVGETGIEPHASTSAATVKIRPSSAPARAFRARNRHASRPAAPSRITDSIDFYAEAKYITEDTFDLSQPTFYDIDLVNSYSAGSANPIYNVANFDLRYTGQRLPAAEREGRDHDQPGHALLEPTQTTPGSRWPRSCCAMRPSQHVRTGPYPGQHP
jgi:hypothetical protein